MRTLSFISAALFLASGSSQAAQAASERPSVTIRTAPLTVTGVPGKLPPKALGAGVEFPAVTLRTAPLSVAGITRMSPSRALEFLPVTLRTNPLTVTGIGRSN